MRKLLVVCAALVAAAVFTGASAADTPTTINIAACTLVHGGQMSVPAGSTISFKISWITRTVGLENLFESALDLNASVDGAPIADPMSYWSALAPTTTVFNPADGYIITWLYPTGITLQSGDSVTLVWSGDITHAITDGFRPVDGGGPVKPGDLLGGNDTCTVTAS